MERVINGLSMYRISDSGSVRSIDRMVNCEHNGKRWTQFCHGKTLVWRVNKHRNNETSVYVTYDDGTSRSMKVSHLVAMAFPEICGEWFDGCDVDHIDTNRMNNNAINLRVTDRKGNMGNPLTREHLCASIDRQARSERMRGDKNPTRKPDYWTEERRRKVGETQTKRYQEHGSPCSKAVQSINKEGIVTEYESISDAFRMTGIPVCQISAACTGRQKTAHGLKWMYI